MEGTSVAGETLPTMTLTPGKVALLEREIYSEAEAAQLLKVSQSVLSYWLDGGERAGRTYGPIIRTRPRGGRPADNVAGVQGAVAVCRGWSAVRLMVGRRPRQLCEDAAQIRDRETFLRTLGRRPAR